jgi:hypothetical protein
VLADYKERRDLTKGLNAEEHWADYCTGMEALLQFNTYTYTVQPKPELGKVDLASVFFNRDKYAQAHVSFGTRRIVVHCLECTCCPACFECMKFHGFKGYI